ncbi:uracil-DNA glycosylase family protein [Sphingomonas sp. DT-204]|uniref:uracil-DNA glycosylase family protein n=1 Tax=Sphingomonas sp. DT-204 TaxID=3396166 RepID=UPI003F1B9BAB
MAMGGDQHHDWRELAQSALDWWREAGVDTLVADTPRDWRIQAAPVAATAAAPLPPEAEATAAPLPATLETFVAWRTGPDAPEAGWGMPLFAPEGDPASGLMIIVDCPEDEALLDGAPGRLFDRMLAAIGRDRAGIYLAALAGARPVGGRIPPEMLPALAALLRHHIALAAPKRLLVAGSAASRALIGTDSARGRGSLHPVHLEVGTVDAVVSWHPRFLLERPAAKAEAWKDLQLLMGGLR